MNKKGSCLIRKGSGCNCRALIEKQATVLRRAVDKKDLRHQIKLPVILITGLVVYRNYKVLLPFLMCTLKVL